MKVREDYEKFYNDLYDGKTVEIRFEDQKGYHSFRVTMVKKHKELVAIGASDLAVRTSFDRRTGVGRFFLGPERRHVAYTIVGEDATLPPVSNSPNFENGGNNGQERRLHLTDDEIDELPDDAFFPKGWKVGEVGEA